MAAACGSLTMRKEAREGYERAKSEAKAAFGSDEVYVEKYISNPKTYRSANIGGQSWQCCPSI